MKTPTNAAIKESENRVQKGQSADYCTIPIKVRINRDAPDGTFHAKASRPLALGPELLQDLAALYRG